ncbi:ATP phosphoribosyltransferase regulatory subunit [Clostridium sp. BJN0001]|uniref:ATP phosphoribosyltransferase regulatory subunit n=1 Tax=Clostridium sp. BJN0001 TaxID=2930219 RepID=UPI001FD4A901|nr:ATP phosphoribosyltransferase regulatory subunit [Clostridium sp. BJN0001]
MNKRNMLPEGTRDIILDDCIIKRTLERKIDDLFKSWGYSEIVTPTLEFYETFNNKVSLNEEDMYKFFDNKGHILVLRPDMTIPIARVMQTKLKDEKLPVKMRYSSNVFRVHESLLGKRNEFTDCGVENIGSSDIESDFEMIVLALEALKNLGLKNFKLEIGNIGFFKSVLKSVDIGDDEKKKLASLIQNKSLKNLEDYLDSLNISEEYKRFFNKLPWMFGGREILNEAKKLVFNRELKENLDYLEDIYNNVEKMGYGENVTFDLGLVLRLNYYTGIIFRGYCDKVGDTILRGGRYDKLIKIKDKYVPSVGFSITVDSLIENMKESGTYKKEEKVILYYNPDKKIEAVNKSNELRKNGQIVSMISSNYISDFKIVKGVEK